MRRLGYLALFLLLALPLATAAPVLGHALGDAEGGVAGAQGTPPRPGRLSPREQNRHGPEAQAWGLPETRGRVGTVHPTSLDWHLEYVDTPKIFSGMGPRSLALDAFGHPHIAYGQDHLYYAWHDGSAWRLETVDTSWSVGLYTSLALDANDQPHISYHDWTHYDLKYAHFDGSDWLTETVDSTGDVGGFTSLALDPSGRPHISYYDSTNINLKYAHFDGSSWQIETVDSAGDVGWYTSLALDSSDRPHISYYDYTNRDLKYAHFDGTTWLTETVDPFGDAGLYTSLALDASGRPHVSYCRLGPGTDTCGDLEYAHFDGISWLTETVDSAGYVGSYTSLALNASGRPHISYHDDDHGDLKYAHFDGTAWQIETVDSRGWMGRYTSLALDTFSQPHISYYDNTKKDLKYAWGECVPVAGASVAGPAALLVGQTGLYTATCAPPTATLPVTLTWDNGTAGPTAIYSWTVPGTYTLIVTATNPCGQVSTSFVVEVCQPVEGVEIAGPAALSVGETGLYTATYTPPTATLPVTFTWDNSTVGPTAAYSWTVTGTHTIAVTATSDCSGPMTDTLDVLVVSCEPAQIVTVTTGISGCVVTFGADLLGDPPFAYLWAFGDGMTGTAAMPAHDYGTSGSYSGTLEVWNCAGGGYDEQPFVVTVECAPPAGYRIYLPLVLRGR